MRAGLKFELTDENILSIDSPRDRVGGPYTVVHKDMDERWAIVTLEFDGTPSLGIRWFYGGGGTPFTRHSTWFILPQELTRATVDTLCLCPTTHRAVLGFLTGDVTGVELKAGKAS